MKKKEKRIFQGAVVLGLILWFSGRQKAAPVKPKVPVSSPAPVNTVNGCYHAAL